MRKKLKLYIVLIDFSKAYGHTPSGEVQMLKAAVLMLISILAFGIIKRKNIWKRLIVENIAWL